MQERVLCILEMYRAIIFGSMFRGLAMSMLAGECRTADLRMSGSGLIDVSQLEGSVNTELTGGGSITTSEGTITKTEGFSVEGVKDTIAE